MTIPSKENLPANIAISTLGCSERSLPEVIQLMQYFGIPNVELRGLDNRLDLPVYLEEQYGSPAAVKQEFEKAGIQSSVWDTSLSLMKHEEENREAFLKFIPFAEALGVPYLRVFDGGTFDGPISDEVVQQAVEQIQWWRALRKSNGWKTDILIETHDACCSSENCLRLEEALDEPIPLLWDTWHIWFKNDETLSDTWNALQPYVKHIHFKDGQRVPKGNFPYQYELPGHGCFPLSALFDRLSADGYSGKVCLEWERKWHPYLPAIEQALDALSEFLAKRS